MENNNNNNVELSKNETFDIEKIHKYLNAMNLASNLTRSEVEQFTEIAQSFGLNPFKREIYASKYGNNFSVIVGFETYIKRAERSGLLSGWNVTTTGELNRKDLKNSNVKAVITIHRKDFNHAFIHEVEFAEYVQFTKDGSVTKFWREKPLTMIKKVAMAQGFRLCFSDELGGLPYTAEELPPLEVHAEVISSNPTKATTEVVQAVVVQGAPKTFKEEVLEIKEILESISAAQDLEALRAVWQKHPELHGNADFKRSINNKKKKLSEPVPDPAPIPDQTTTDSLTEEEAIKRVQSIESKDELIELVASETRQDVLSAAMEQMNLFDQTEENETK
jgi:phage recombination protein Bet